MSEQQSDFLILTNKAFKLGQAGFQAEVQIYLDRGYFIVSGGYTDSTGWWVMVLKESWTGAQSEDSDAKTVRIVEQQIEQQLQGFKDALEDEITRHIHNARGMS